MIEFGIGIVVGAALISAFVYWVFKDGGAVRFPW
jgi:hypothetical protein